MFYNSTGNLDVLKKYSGDDASYRNKIFAFVYNNNLYFCKRAVEGSNGYLISQSLYQEPLDPVADVISQLESLQLHHGIGPFPSSISIELGDYIRVIGIGEYIYRTTINHGLAVTGDDYMVIDMLPTVYNIVGNNDKTGFHLIFGNIDYTPTAIRQGLMKLYWNGNNPTFTCSTTNFNNTDIQSISLLDNVGTVTLKNDHSRYFKYDLYNPGTTTYCQGLPGGDVAHLRLKSGTNYIIDEFDVNLVGHSQQEGTITSYTFSFPDNGYTGLTAELY